MNDVIATVRLPKRLKEEMQEIVKEGYYKNVSDLLVAGARHEVEKLPRNLRLVKKARKQIWLGYLKKAGGDADKAVDLYYKDIKKAEQEQPEFFKY